MKRDPPSPSRRRAYLEWVEEQIENYKESVSREVLLGVADEVVTELRVNARGQYQLTELLLAEAVDRQIFRMLKLPSYRSWLAARPVPVPGRSTSQTEHESLPLPEAASF